MKKAYLSEIDLIRAFAIIGVLLTHSTSFTIVQLDPNSTLYSLYIFLNRFGKLSTPTFIFLSSFVLFYNYYSKPINKDSITHFYKKRVSNIVVPYLLWSLIYYIVALEGATMDPTKIALFNFSDFSIKLLFGKAYTHLYFVIVNIQFYIFFPLFWYLLKRYQNLAKYFFILGFALQWIFIFYNHNILHFPYKGSLSLSYLSNYTLGATAAIYYPTISKWLREFRLLKTIPLWKPVTAIWFLLGLAYTTLYYYGYGYNVWVYSLWYELSWNLYTLWSILVLYYLAIFILNKTSERSLTLFKELGLASFGIYLIHPLFLLFWRKLPLSKDPLVYHTSVLGGFLVALLGSWLIVYLVQKHFSWSWMVFGLSRKRNKATINTSLTSDV